MKTSTSSLVLLVLLLAGAGCPKNAAPLPPPTPPAPLATSWSIFSDDFKFSCSPQVDVGCSGIFPVRRPDPQRPVRVAVLESGEDSFRARTRLLEEAKTSIRIQALIFRGDEAGLHFAELLKRKKKQGVDVKVVVDALSNLEEHTQWMYFDLKQHHIEVEGYETLYLNWLAADLTAKDPLRPNKRFHDKMWVVDGETGQGRAIVGGLNVANEYFRLDPTPINRWRDQDILVEGVLVDDVTAAFDRNYQYFKSLKERLPKVFNPDNSWNLTRAVLDRVGKAKLPDWRKPVIQGVIQETLAASSVPQVKDVAARFVQSRPRFEEDYIKQVYDVMIDQASSRLLIANAYFVPSKDLLERLKNAARRGVHVRIITNSPATNDIAPVAAISRHLYARLLDVNEEPGMAQHVAQGKGLEVWEWVGPSIGEGTLHAKFAVADVSRVIVGSYNLDPRSERLNSETAMAIDSADIANALVQRFETVDLKKSRRVTLQEARGYHIPDGLDGKFELLYSLPLKRWL